MRSKVAALVLVVLSAPLGAACSDDVDTGAASTVVTVTATNYRTLPPTPTTDAVPTTAVNAPGAVTQFETEYVIAPGDLPATIARSWNVSLQALLDANGWVLEGQFVPAFPPPGTTIKIPAGATVPGIPAPGTGTTVAPGSATSAPPTATTAPATTAAPTTTVGGCGTYVITAEDTARVKVAEKFNTTVAKLDAANANTPGYSGFYPGLEIKLPC